MDTRIQRISRFASGSLAIVVLAAVGCAGSSSTATHHATAVAPHERHKKALNPAPSATERIATTKPANEPAPSATKPPAVESPAEVIHVSSEENASEGAVALELAVESSPESTPPPSRQIGPQAEGDLTLAAFEQLALEHNPAIKQLAASAHSAIGVRDQVGQYPNPEVGYWASQLADRNTDQQGVHIQQEFVRGNKLGLNKQVLNQSVQVQMWEVETQRFRVLTDVRMRFYEALAAQRRVELTTEFLQVVKAGVERARQRREAGEGTQVDYLQAEIQLQSIDLIRQQAEVAFRGAWQSLVAVAGVPNMRVAHLSTTLPTGIMSRDWDSVYETLVDCSPELQAARARVAQAAANLERQEAQPIPNVTVQLQAGADQATDSGMLNLQVTGPIPVLNRNTGNISAAYAEYCRATQDVQRLQMALKSRLARTTQEFDAALASVNVHANGILPRARETLSLSEQAYDAGELSFLQVLVVRQTYFEANLRYVQSLGEVAQANAKVDGLLLTGGLEVSNEFSGDDALRGQTFSGL